MVERVVPRGNRYPEQPKRVVPFEAHNTFTPESAQWAHNLAHNFAHNPHAQPSHAAAHKHAQTPAHNPSAHPLRTTPAHNPQHWYTQ